MSSNIFRTVSLERLSSPEQLDALMPVINPKSWLALLALTAVLAAGFYWSWVGRIPQELSTPTVLLPAGGFATVVNTTTGQLQTWHVQPGAQVEANQLVAEVIPLGETSAQPVYSLFPGRVADLKATAGQLLRVGEPLLLLDSTSPTNPLQATLYLSAEQTQQLQVDLPVTLQLPNGAIITGRILTIGNFPVAPALIAQQVGNAELATQLTTSNTPLAVQVGLDELPAGVTAGTVAQATILLGYQRPLDLLLAR